MRQTEHKSHPVEFDDVYRFGDNSGPDRSDLIPLDEKSVSEYLF